MKVKDNLLSKDFDDVDILNMLLYSVVIFMPFIVTKIARPYYVSGKILYLYIISIAVIITLIKLKVGIFNVGKEEIILYVFILSLIVATIFAIDTKIALFGWDGRFEGLAMYLVYSSLFIASVKCIKIYNFIPNLLGIVGSSMSVYSIFEYYKIDPIYKWLFNTDEGIFAVGTIGNRNFLSTYLLMFLILSICMYIFYKKNSFLVYATIIFAGLLVTYTRSGWVSLGICVLSGLGFILKRKGCMRRALIITLIFLSVFTVLETTGDGEFLFRFKSIVSEGEDNAEEAGSGRILIWKTTLKAIKYKPILGTGLDTLQLRLIRDNFDGLYEYIEKYDKIIDKAHNEFLEYWACGGILTLISYVALIGVILTKLFKRREDDGCKIYFLMILGYVIQSFFNISVIGVAPLYWILLGAAVKHYRDLDKAKEVQAIAE